MNKIIAHIKQEATHADAANKNNIQHAVKSLTLTILHDDLCNKRKTFQNDNDFASACRKIQQKAAKTDCLDLTVQLNIAKLCINFNNFNFLNFANHSYIIILHFDSHFEFILLFSFLLYF